MIDTEIQSVKFDPGIAKHTTILSISTDYIYQNIDKIKNFGQKKLKFKIYYPQIVRMIDNNIGFCMGSMLWAIYIKSLGNINIEGNPCYGDTYNEAETVEEINFLTEFLSKLKKDAKYYINTNYEINPVYIKILNLYKEFLVINKNFVSTKTTNDLILPDNFKKPSADELQKIYSKIGEVTKNGKLIELSEVFGYVF